jgi:hypothetical protein
MSVVVVAPFCMAIVKSTARPPGKAPAQTEN